MKITRTKTLVGLALTSLALAGGSTAFAQGSTNILSTFDTDLRAPQGTPYETNLWGVGDSPLPTAIVWTNVGNPGGSMKVVLDWTPTVEYWTWSDAKCQVSPWSSNAVPVADAIDLAKYDNIEYDASVDTSVSQTNLGGGYGQIQTIAQSFYGTGNNPTNINTGYHELGPNQPLPTTGWAHFSKPVSSWPWALSRLTLNFNMQENTNPGSLHVVAMVDNVKFTAAGQPPTLTYTKASRGLNLWTTGNQYDRTSIRVYQDGSNPLSYMWYGVANAGNPVTYSFTVAPNGFPMGVGGTNFFCTMFLYPADTTDSASDWNLPNVIWTQLGITTNQPPTAFWSFHWKTNAPGQNGQFYEATNQVTITNPTPVGKWTLKFTSDTTFSMTSPNGNTTNVTMGVTLGEGGGVIVPDISLNFADYGSVFLGTFINTNTAAGNEVIYSAAYVGDVLGNLNIVSNNWALETGTETGQRGDYPAPVNWTNNWQIVAGAPTWLVPVDNARWLNWTVPDGGFHLQTNGTGVGMAANWSTNNVPTATPFLSKKTILIKPTDLPASQQLFFRLANPGY
jgi:hypothetical protein